MFVNISPAEYNMEETVTTLVYGSRAKMITNDTQKNVETRMQARMNEAYKKMQSQLDLAIESLRKNNIPIPGEITIEPTAEMKLDEVKEEPPEDITKMPEFKQDAGAAAVNSSQLPENEQIPSEHPVPSNPTPPPQ